jgi:hypothetical protein
VRIRLARRAEQGDNERVTLDAIERAIDALGLAASVERLEPSVGAWL